MVFQVDEPRQRELYVKYVGSSRSRTDVARRHENGTRLQISPPRPRFEIRPAKADGLEFSAGHYFHSPVDLALDGLKSLETPPLGDVRHDSNVWHTKRIRLLGREVEKGDITGPGLGAPPSAEDELSQAARRVDAGRYDNSGVSGRAVDERAAPRDLVPIISCPSAEIGQAPGPGFVVEIAPGRENESVCSFYAAGPLSSKT